MKRLTIVSGDGHAAPPIGQLRPYLEAKYHPAFDEFAQTEAKTYTDFISGPAYPKPEAIKVFDLDGRFAAGGETGGYDWSVREKEMDAEGCVCEIVHSGTQASPTLWYGIVNRPTEPELRDVGARAYNHWLADMMAQADGRMFGVAEPGPCLDLKATVKELHWLADHRFKSIGVPGISADPALPPLYDAYYEPFWSACEDLGIVLSVHAGWGQAQGTFYKFFEMMSGGGRDPKEGLAALREELVNSETSPLALDIGPRRVMWQLILGGVFDRHPDLRLVFTEVRADWVPTTLAELDRRAAALDAPLKMRPSEYFARHCAVTPSSIHRVEVEMRHEIGLRQLMFGIDYPHYEGTWPNTPDWIRAAFAGVPEGEARGILGDNAIDFYRLDRARLEALAARIGPKAEDVLVAEPKVDPALIGHFHARDGFNKQAAPVNVKQLEEAFADDLAGVAARRS
jgi:predicted TIM-barrel fold metal-dependent hydrolase